MKEKMREYFLKFLHKNRRNAIGWGLTVALSMYKKIKRIISNSDNKSIALLSSRLASIERHLKDGKIKFVTVDNAVSWTNEWAKVFPDTFDIVVGIPRSGLLIANILSLKLGKPLSTPDLFCRDEFWTSRVGRSGLSITKDSLKNVLLVDDSIDKGTTMEENLRRISAYRQDINVTTAVLIAGSQSMVTVDLNYKVIPQPRLFEWNLLHAKKASLGSDMDGVICENCPTGVDLDEDLYVEWIKNAKPYLIPNFKIDFILSNRLEKYRLETEEWLDKHKVNYGELNLWAVPNKHEREGKFAQRKIEILMEFKPEQFWESNLSQAKSIWQATRIPTLCVDEMVFFS